MRRALVENNLIDGNWKDGQDGSPILLTPRNQDRRHALGSGRRRDDSRQRGAPDRRRLRGEHSGAGQQPPSGQTARVTIERNLFVDARSGIRVVGGVDGALTVRRNTFPAIRYNWFAFSGKGPLTPLTVTGNVTRSGSYGISGDGSTAVGAPSLKLAKVVTFTGNIIEQTAERGLADGNTLLSPEL